MEMTEIKKKEETGTERQLEQIYEILLSQFNDTRERTKYLSDKAHNLLGFDGVINSILVALVVLLAKDQSTRDLLSSSPYFGYLNASMALGFSCYITSTIFALLSFRATKYKRAPFVGSMDFIKEVRKGKAKLSLEHMLIQVFDAIEFTDEVNKNKYNYLMVATVFLLAAIVCTALIGILVFLSIG